MTLQRLLGSPTALCFRTELQRRWTPRVLRNAASFLALIVMVQIAATVLLNHGGLRPGWMMWVWRVAANLGLLTSLGELPVTHLRGVPELSPWTIPWMIIASLAAAVMRFLLPAFMATSIAPDREQGRLSELMLTGFKPCEILLGKALASALPFSSWG
jgi:hypothetical protein